MHHDMRAGRVSVDRFDPARLDRRMRRVLPVLFLVAVFPVGCGSDEGGTASNVASGGSGATGGSGGSGGTNPSDSGTPDTSQPTDGGAGADASAMDAETDSATPDSGPCDPGFSFSPAQPATGEVKHVAYTFDEPLA